MEAMRSNDRLRWLLTAVVVVLAMLLAQRWHSRSASRDPTVLLPAADLEPASATIAPARPQIAVDVVGAVERPGLYYLGTEARVADAIQAAGGLAPNADRDAVNFAARVKDEQQLRIPRAGEARTGQPGPQASSAAMRERLDLNTADATALDALPGIGAAMAKEIVAYRAAHGAFQSIDQLDDISGIGRTTIEGLRDLVTVGRQAPGP